jgi:NADPH:quinone reductase-like Zn-dependent oxidoreductase
VRAVQVSRFGGPEVLEPVDLPTPEPIPTEVRVRVQAAGVNPVDWKNRQGGARARALYDPPFVLGWDVAGVVDSVGGGVTRFAVGDEVFGMPWFPRLASAYAEYVTAPSRQFARIPHPLDTVQAGGLPLAGLTAWQALVDTAKLERGDRVLIHAAAGGVGHLAVQIAKARGAHIVATARANKHEFLRGLGVERLIDYTDVAFEAEAGEVDVVLDLIGTEDYGMRSLQTLREGGLLIQVPSGAPDSVNQAARDQGKRSTGILVEPDGQALEQLAALADAGELRVEVAETLPLEQAARAHELGEEGRVQGKLVLVP